MNPSAGVGLARPGRPQRRAAALKAEGPTNWQPGATAQQLPTKYRCIVRSESPAPVLVLTASLFYEWVVTGDRISVHR